MSKKKAAKKKATKKKPALKPRKPRPPRQEALPGMEDRGIRELEDKANQLDDAQTQKKEYSALVGVLNDELVDLMVKHGKTEYHHKSVHVTLPPQKQKAKVTIGEFPETEPDTEPEEDSPELRESAEVVHAND